MTESANNLKAVGILQSCPLFSGLDETQRKILAELAVSRSFQRNEQIFVEGHECPGVFIVESGLVRIYRKRPDGQQHVLHLCGPRHSFAEVAVFGDFPLPANAMAMQPTQCLIIPRQPLLAAMDDSHSLCRQLILGMSKWTRHFVQMLDDIVLRDAAGRVARLLGDLPTDESGYLQLPGPKKDIANHLNLTSETFSRVLKRMTDQSLIKVSANRQIRIVARSQLEDFCNS